MTVALTTESLDRRFDDAFGIVRSEKERNAIMTTKIQTLEKALANLGEGFALDDDIRRELNELKFWLRDRGIDPYEPPPTVDS